jgi:hypothetical protein
MRWRKPAGKDAGKELCSSGGFPAASYDGFWRVPAQCIAESRDTESPRGTGKSWTRGLRPLKRDRAIPRDGRGVRAVIGGLF